MGNHSILIADDHEIVRHGLNHWIEQVAPGSGVWEAGSYDELRDILGKRVFTHLILDLRLYGQNMLEKLPFIRSSNPDLPIMVYSMQNVSKYKKVLLEMGASGFLSKASNEADTLSALRQFFQYNSYLEELAGQREHAAAAPGPEKDVFCNLSFRERQMADFFLTGETAKQIQYKLNLKSSTVSTIKRRILGKLKISNITELIKLAYERGAM
jgi:two-component system invasion response regulator UvrY